MRKHGFKFLGFCLGALLLVASARSADLSGTDRSEFALVSQRLHLDRAKSFEEIRMILKKAGYVEQHVGVARSRSRQEKYIDFRNPRLILSYSRPGYPPDFFLGYSEKAYELEAFSRDRYERSTHFYLGSNLGRPGHGMKKIERVPSSSCIACHPGGTPNFWDPPWLGTTFDPLTKCMISKMRGNMMLAGINLEHPGSARDFELSIVARGRTLLADRACNVACAHNWDCKRDLLIAGMLSAFDDRSSSVESRTSWRFLSSTDFATVVRRTWPREGLGQSSPILGNESPFDPHGDYAAHELKDPKLRNRFQTALAQCKKDILINDRFISDFDLKRRSIGFASVPMPPNLKAELADQGPPNPFDPRPVGTQSTFVSHDLPVITERASPEFMADMSWSCTGLSFEDLQRIKAKLSPQQVIEIGRRIPLTRLKRWPPDPDVLAKSLFGSISSAPPAQPRKPTSSSQ